MRLFLIALISIPLASCSSPATPPDPVADATANFSRIKMGMTSNEVYRLIGPYERVDSNGCYEWSVVGATTNHYARLRLIFNASGQVSNVVSESHLKLQTGKRYHF